MITLSASGTVKECGGYCLIENALTGIKAYTQTIMPDEIITVAFTPSADGTYTFTGVWGSLPIGITEKDIIRKTTETVADDDQKPTVADETTPPASVPVEPTTEETIGYVDPEPDVPDEPTQSETEPPTEPEADASTISYTSE